MKITLEKYQIIDAIWADKSLDETDKILYCICALYNYAPEQLDKEDPFKVAKMIAKVEKAFKFKVSAPTMIGIYKINYKIDSITFGQYIELSYFFQFNLIDKANYIVASCAKGFGSHPKKAAYLNRKSVNVVMGAVNKIRNGFIALNKEFGSLFGLDEEQHSHVQTDNFLQQFNKRYGWQFSAEVVANYERISVEEVYNLPVKRALNDLVYLKAKDKYLYLLSKK